MGEDIGELVVKVAMENSSFQQGVQGLNRELKVVQSEFKAASAQLGEHGKKLDALKINADMLSKSFETQAKIVEAYQNKLKESQNTLESNAKKQIEVADAVVKSEKAYKDSLNTLGKNAEETKKLKQEHEKLLNEYSSGEEKIRNNQRSIDNWTIKTNNAKAKLSELQSELKSTNESIKIHGSSWNESASKLQSWGSKAKGVGDNIKNVGQSINNHVSLPLFGVAAVAVKVGADFESQMSRVQAVSGATGEEFTQLNELALKLGADTSFSAKEAALGMENLASAGFSTKEIMVSMPGMLDLAASSGADLATSADIAASTLRGFGLEASQAGHVADVLAKAAADTNANVLDTGEAMKYVAPVARAMGWSLEEVTASIGKMSDAGIKGSQAGTTLRSALTSLASPSKEAAGLMDEFGFKAFDTNGKLLPLKDVITNLQTATKGLTDEQKQNFMATVFGQEAMSGMLTLVQSGPEEIDKLTQSLKNSDGASKEMAETMKNNLKGSIDQLKGSLETAAIKLEQNLAPSLKSVTENLTGMINKFGEADPSTQKLTLTLGAVGIAAGPAIIGVGNLVKAVGSISEVTGLSMATLGPWGLGIAAVGVAAFGLAKYLKSDCVQAVDLFATRVLDDNAKISKSFGDMDKKTKASTTDFNNKVKASAVNSNTELLKISDATKKAVKAYVDLDKKAGTALLSLKANNTKVTKQIATDMSKNIDDMSKQIVSGLNKRSSEAQNTLSAFFKNAKNITDKEKEEILNKSKEGYANQAKSAEDAKNKINQIYETAANNNRQITQDEFNQIQQLQEQMKQQAIQTLTQSQLEQQAIFEGMKNNAVRLSTEQASDVIKNSANQRDKTIAAATEQAQKVESEIIYQRDVTHTISADQANKLISEAERQKNDSISKANEMHTKVVEEVSQQCDGVKNTIDSKSGEIKSTWQTLCDWFESHVIHPKVQMTTNLADNAKGVYEKKTDDGYATGTNNATRGWHMVGEEGPEMLWFDGGETVLNNNDTMSLFEKLDNKIGYVSAKAWGSDLCQGFADGLNEYSGLVHDAAINVANKMYRVLHFSVPDEGPLKDADQYGTDFMELLANSMEESSDKPENAAKKVAELVSNKIQEIKEKVKQDTKGLNEELYAVGIDQEKSLRGVKGASRYPIQDEYETKKKSIKDQIALRKEQAKKEIEQIQKIGKMSKEQMKEELDAKKKAVSDIDKLNDLILKALKRKVEAERDSALEAARTKAKESKLTKDQLSSLLSYTKEFYDKKLDQDKLQALAEQIIMSKNQEAIINLLNKFGDLYEDSGTTLGQRMVYGMKSWTDMVPGIVGNAMQNVQGTVQTAAVNIQNTLSSIMGEMQAVGNAGASLGAFSGGGGNFNFDSIFSDWKSNKTDEDKVKEITDKYKQAFNKIELAMVKLGKEARNSDEELRKQDKTIDLQKDKLNTLKKEYEDIKKVLSENDDEVISLKNDIASLTVEIENNELKLKQDRIANKYSKDFEEIEIALIKLGKTSHTFDEEMDNQRKVLEQQANKLTILQREYKELARVLGEDAEAVRELKKEILNLEVEISNTNDKLKQDMIAHVNEFTGEIKEALKGRYEEELKLEEDKLNKELENLNKWKDESIKRIDDVYNAKIKALDEEVKAEDRAEKDREELQKINSLKESMLYEHNEFNKAEMQKNLNKLIDDRNKRLHKEEIEDKKKNLEEQKQSETDSINNLYIANKNKLERQLEDTKAFYANKLKSASLEAEAELLVAFNEQEKIVSLLKNFGGKYEEAGKTLGDRLFEGFKPAVEKMQDMISNVIAQLHSIRTAEIESAINAVDYSSIINIPPVSSSTINNDSKTVVNHNSITFNSPKSLSPSEMRRKTETTLRDLAFNI